MQVLESSNDQGHADVERLGIDASDEAVVDRSNVLRIAWRCP
jgi:hypothetical protein